MQGNWKTGFNIAWAKYPFVKVLLPFLSGILLADHLDVSIPKLALLVLIAALVQFVIHLQTKKDIYTLPSWFSILAWFFWIAFGLLWTTLRDERNLPQHFKLSHHNELITRTYYLEEKDRYWDCYSNVIAQIDSDGIHPVNGNILIRMAKSYHATPATRDIYQGVYSLHFPDKASAPFEFDWNDLLHRRNIHHLTYVDTTRFKIIFHAQPNLLERSRNTLDSAIQAMIPSARDYPVASAMLIGLRKKMDPELYRAYSATGAVHVLSVSGMHVGILASILAWLFGFIKSRNKLTLILKPITILVIIWIYTFLTGATPSILRSAIMFSCFILARTAQRDAAPMNILSGTAFILLFLNPLDIFNIGFQLSFGAMAGIFLLYEPIRQLIPITNKFVQLLWKITSVSLAAQLLIYPIVGYHFHQFAFYFWLTSLISSPFSFVILVGGMLALPLYFIPIPWLHIFYYPLIYSVKWMNDIIAWVYTLPLGRVRGWWPSIPECILLVVISILFGQFLSTKTLKSLQLVLVALILLTGLMSVDEILDQQRTELIATKNRGHPTIWLKHKMALIQIKGDSLLLQSNYAEKYNMSKLSMFRLDTTESSYSSEDYHLTPHVLTKGSSSYSWITHQDQPFASASNILFLANRWKNEASHINSHVHLIPPVESEWIKKIFPQSQIEIADKNYIQIPFK